MKLFLMLLLALPLLAEKPKSCKVGEAVPGTSQGIDCFKTTMDGLPTCRNLIYDKQCKAVERPPLTYRECLKIYGDAKDSWKNDDPGTGEPSWDFAAYCAERTQVLGFKPKESPPAEQVKK